MVIFIFLLLSLISNAIFRCCRLVVDVTLLKAPTRDLPRSCFRYLLFERRTLFLIYNMTLEPLRGKNLI
jgi:hypothetical protein